MVAVGQTPKPLKDYDCDIAIAGGGIVGITLACALKATGLRVMVLEARPESVAASKGQAYAVSVLSSRIFQQMGIWEQMRSQIAPFRQIRLSDADHPQVVRFLPPDLGTEDLGYVAEHGVLLNILQTHLKSCPNVSVLCPAEVVAAHYHTDWVDLELVVEGEKRHLRTRLLVAADGARSRLRTAAGIKTRGWQYWQSCIVCTVRPEQAHQNIAYERFWPAGPFAILPLTQNRCRIVWTAPHAEAKALVSLSDDEFLVELRRRYGDQMGNLALEGERFVFPVQWMQSDRYISSRLALVGDAAHCCHPVGGQGLNMGIRDAAALAQVLQKAWERGEDLGSVSVLRRYERWRKPENLLILGFTDFLVRCFSSQWLPLVIIRRWGLWGLQKIRPLKIYALRLMTGLSGKLPLNFL